MGNLLRPEDVTDGTLEREINCKIKRRNNSKSLSNESPDDQTVFYEALEDTKASENTTISSYTHNPAGHGRRTHALTFCLDCSRAVL